MKYTKEMIKKIEADHAKVVALYESNPKTLRAEKLDAAIYAAAQPFTRPDIIEGYSILESEGLPDQIQISVSSNGDAGVHLFDLEALMNKTTQEIFSHDDQISLKISDMGDEKRALHSVEYITVRDAISSCEKAGIDMEIPEWYPEHNRRVQKLDQDIITSTVSKYHRFRWANQSF